MIPFVCPYCEREYKTERGLDNHVKGKHAGSGGTVSQEETTGGGLDPVFAPKGETEVSLTGSSEELPPPIMIGSDPVMIVEPEPDGIIFVDSLVSSPQAASMSADEIIGIIRGEPVLNALLEAILEVRSDMGQGLAAVNDNIDLLLTRPHAPSEDADALAQIDGLITRLGVEDSVKQIIQRLPQWGDNAIASLTGKEPGVLGIPAEFQSQMQEAYSAKLLSEKVLTDNVLRAARSGQRIILMSPEDEQKAVELGVLDPEVPVDE